MILDWPSVFVTLAAVAYLLVGLRCKRLAERWSERDPENATQGNFMVIVIWPIILLVISVCALFDQPYVGFERTGVLAANEAEKRVKQ